MWNLFRLAKSCFSSSAFSTVSHFLRCFSCKRSQHRVILQSPHEFQWWTFKRLQSRLIHNRFDIELNWIECDGSHKSWPIWLNNLTIWNGIICHYFYHHISITTISFHIIWYHRPFLTIATAQILFSFDSFQTQLDESTMQPDESNCKYWKFQTSERTKWKWKCQWHCFFHSQQLLYTSNFYFYFFPLPFLRSISIFHRTIETYSIWQSMASKEYLLVTKWVGERESSAALVCISER